MSMDDRIIVNDIQSGSTQSSLACSSCRRKKLKCDRTVPHCRHCIKASRLCEYPAVAQKPGPRPGTHRRTQNAAHARQSRPSFANSAPVRVFAPRQNHVELCDDKPQLSNTLSSEQSAQTTASSNGSPFSLACRAMDMSEKACLEMIDLYFRNMAAVSLFHQPTFLTKLADIDSAKHLEALLTSMLAFCSRYMQPSPTQNLDPAVLLDRAHALNDECLRDCTDESPPLHLLQSSLIAAHLATTRGVRGKAWRLVGQCVRIAYELRLHEVDQDLPEVGTAAASSARPPSECWIAFEEKRRAWWVTFECDLFSSSIRRLPTSIDWTRVRTNLPSCDEAWFAGRAVPSCWLHVDPNKRWKAMKECGNTSPHAWFLVLDSYKWDALAATLRASAPTTLCNDEDDNLKGLFDPSSYKPMSVRRREVIENCLRCALAAVPESLQFNGGYLAFEPSKDRSPSHNLVRDYGIYIADIIVQVTQILLCRKDVHGSEYICFLGDPIREKAAIGREAVPPGSTVADIPDSGASKRRRWQMCLLAADRIALVVRNAAPHHYRLTNPNIATALWMAAATQLIALTHYRDEIDVDLAQSNLDLLSATIENFVEFWDVPKPLYQSLPVLRKQLQTLALARRPQTAVQTSTPANNTIDQSPRPNFPQDNTSNNPSNLPSSHAITVQTGNTQPEPTHPLNVDMNMDIDLALGLEPIDVLQAMDYGTVYNGDDDWEAMFLDPTTFTNGFGF